MKFVESLRTPINKSTGTRNHTEISDVDEAVRYVERGGTTLEYLTPRTITKLYFDKDCYQLAQSDTEGIEALRVKGCELIKKYLGQSGAELSNDDIAIAQRHRLVTKNGRKVWKTSFRYYVPAFSMEFQYIKSFLESQDDTFFDLLVYGPKEQLYSCVFNAKDRNDKGDNKVLEPITSHATEDFIVQVVSEEATKIDGKGI